MGKQKLLIEMIFVPWNALKLPHQWNVHCGKVHQRIYKGE